MMTLLLSQRSYAIHKIQRLLEIGKLKFAVNVVLVRDRPLGHTLIQLLQFFPFEWGSSSLAGDALLISQLF
jgi:hypothetical protein